jgi:hypothetical protein
LKLLHPFEGQSSKLVANPGETVTAMIKVSARAYKMGGFTANCDYSYSDETLEKLAMKEEGKQYKEYDIWEYAYQHEGGVFILYKNNT